MADMQHSQHRPGLCAAVKPGLATRHKAPAPLLNDPLGPHSFQVVYYPAAVVRGGDTVQPPNATPVWIDLGPLGCSTPHLVALVPNSTLAATACRCSNPGDTHRRCGRLAALQWWAMLTYQRAQQAAGTLTLTASGRVSRGAGLHPAS